MVGESLLDSLLGLAEAETLKHNPLVYNLHVNLQMVLAVSILI